MSHLWSFWVNLIVGILLIISPFVLGYSGDANAMWTAVIGGAIVAIVSALALAYRGRALA